MKHAYIQPQVKVVSLIPVRFFAVSGSSPEPKSNTEHKLTKWIGSREGDFFEDEEEEDDSLW